MARELTDTEIETIVAHLVREPFAARNIALVRVLQCCGYRISEVLSLRVADVVEFDRVADQITVSRRNMKGKIRSRTIVLRAEAKGALSRYVTSDMSQNSRLFDISRQHADRIIRNAAKACRIPGKVSAHSFRKAFCMRVYSNSGKDIAVTQRAMGHVSLSSTSHYVSAPQTAVDAAILGKAVEA